MKMQTKDPLLKDVLFKLKSNLKILYAIHYNANFLPNCDRMELIRESYKLIDSYLRIKELSSDRETLSKLAREHPPPQSWYEEDDNPFVL